MARALEPPEIERAIKSLPRRPAPEGLWQDIVDELSEPVPETQPNIFRRPVRSSVLAVAALFVAFVGGSYIGLYRTFRTPSQWQVVPLAGVPNVAGEGLSARANIGIGQWLVTDSLSSAQIEVGRIGTAQVGPNSRVRLDTGRRLEHRLTLERGSIDAVITAPPRLLFVQTPTVLATDLGCAYVLSVDSVGNTQIHVTAGWVELEQGGRVSIVPAGMIADVEEGVGPGTPHPAWLSPASRAALRRIDLGGPSAGDLEAVMAELDTDVPAVAVRKERAITLWHLIQRVDVSLRGLVFDRLENLSPAPEGVTREGILALERPMLERWRRDLNPLWSEEAQPILVRLARWLWDWTMK